MIKALIEALRKAQATTATTATDSEERLKATLTDQRVFDAMISETQWQKIQGFVQ